MNKFVLVLFTFLIVSESLLFSADYVYPTVKGTNVRDYSKPGYKIETDKKGNKVAYPTVKGTNIRDYSKPGYRIETDKKGNQVAYPTVKGTSIRDYSQSATK